MITYSTSQFTWDKASSVFSAEASTLDWKPGVSPDSFQNDCIILRSEKTGKEIQFYLEDWAPSDDYSGGWWKMIFSPASENFTVVVFND